MNEISSLFTILCGFWGENRCCPHEFCVFPAQRDYSPDPLTKKLIELRAKNWNFHPYATHTIQAMIWKLFSLSFYLFNIFFVWAMTKNNELTPVVIVKIHTHTHKHMLVVCWSIINLDLFKAHISTRAARSIRHSQSV